MGRRVEGIRPTWEEAILIALRDSERMEATYTDLLEKIKPKPSRATFSKTLKKLWVKGKIYHDLSTRKYRLEPSGLEDISHGCLDLVTDMYGWNLPIMDAIYQHLALSLYKKRSSKFGKFILKTTDAVHNGNKLDESQSDVKHWAELFSEGFGVRVSSNLPLHTKILPSNKFYMNIWEIFLECWARINLKEESAPPPRINIMISFDMNESLLKESKQMYHASGESTSDKPEWKEIWDKRMSNLSETTIPVQDAIFESLEEMYKLEKNKFDKLKKEIRENQS